MADIVSMCLVEAENKVGELAAITSELKQAGVNIRAICAWTEDSVGKMFVLADDCDKACQICCDKATSCEMHEALLVMVQNEVGALNGILDKVAQAGINVKLALATACGEQTLVVIDTDNNAEAAKVC